MKLLPQNRILTTIYSNDKRDNNILIVDLDSYEYYMKLTAYIRNEDSVLIMKDKLIVYSLDKCIEIWNLTTKTRDMVVNSDSCIYSIRKFSDTEFMTCSNDEQLKIWNLNTGHCNYFPTQEVRT